MIARWRLTVIDHPLAAERLTILRDSGTPNAEFRQALDGLAGMLIYEATRDLPTEEIDGRHAARAGRRASASRRRPMLVPILRAGVGMVGAALRLVPNAEVGFVGLARNEETFQPMPYLAKLPERLDGRPVFVLDPMLATGGSLDYTAELLVERGAPEPITVVCVLAAPEGIERAERVGHRRADRDGVDRQPPQRPGLHRARASATPATASSACGSSAGPEALRQRPGDGFGVTELRAELARRDRGRRADGLAVELHLRLGPARADLDAGARPRGGSAAGWRPAMSSTDVTAIAG